MRRLEAIKGQRRTCGRFFTFFNAVTRDALNKVPQSRFVNRLGQPWNSLFNSRSQQEVIWYWLKDKNNKKKTIEIENAKILLFNNRDIQRLLGRTPGLCAGVERVSAGGAATAALGCQYANAAASQQYVVTITSYTKWITIAIQQIRIILIRKSVQFNYNIIVKKMFASSRRCGVRILVWGHWYQSVGALWPFRGRYYAASRMVA